MENKIILRPHHCLCISFFIGRGYSKEFVRNIAEIIRILDISNPEIILTDSCDDICVCCPNHIGGKCKAWEKVSGIDNRCLDNLSLCYGDRIHWKKLKNFAKENIIDCGKLSSVCCDCQWKNICIGQTE